MSFVIRLSFVSDHTGNLEFLMRMDKKGKIGFCRLSAVVMNGRFGRQGCGLARQLLTNEIPLMHSLILNSGFFSDAKRSYGSHR